MILLILALLFGIAVAIFVTAAMKKAKAKGGETSKIVKVLKMVVLIEALVLAALFVIVLVKTMFM